MIINNLDDTLLINNIKTGAELNESTKELIHRHSGVYFKVASQFKNNPLVNFNDVIDNKDFNIYHAAINYDSSRGTFCNLVGQMARYECLKRIQAAKNNKVDSIDESERPENIFESADSVVRNINFNETYETINEVLQSCNETEREIFLKRLDGDQGCLSWREMTENSEYSHESLRTKNKKVVKKLREKLSVV